MNPLRDAGIVCLNLCAAALLAVSALSAAAGQGSDAPTLLVNGDFEAGNTGFTTDYGVATAPGTLPGQEGKYTVGSDPHTMNALGGSFGDHTPGRSGRGKMLIVNGAIDPKIRVVWSQSVPVKPHTVYRLTFWVASWGRVGDSAAVSPALLRVTVNGIGQGTGSASAAPDGIGEWKPVSFEWRSGASTQAQIIVIDQNTAFVGNDFALDDVSLCPVAKEIPPGKGAALSSCGAM